MSLSHLPLKSQKETTRVPPTSRTSPRRSLLHPSSRPSSRPSGHPSSLSSSSTRSIGGARVLRPTAPSTSREKTVPLPGTLSGLQSSQRPPKRHLPTETKSPNVPFKRPFGRVTASSSKPSPVLPPRPSPSSTLSSLPSQPSRARVGTSNNFLRKISTDLFNETTNSSNRSLPSASGVSADKSRADSRQENRDPEGKSVNSRGAESGSTVFNVKKITQADVDSGKPFRGMKFLLDVENKKASQLLDKDVCRLGGSIVQYMDDDSPPNLVISDHSTAEKLETLSNPLRQMSAVQLRAVPRLIREGWNLRVRLRSLKKFQEIIDGLKERVKDALRKKYGEVVDELSTSRKTGPGSLKEPFLKLEILPQLKVTEGILVKRRTQHYRPWIVELKESEICTKLFLGKWMGRCVFNKGNEEELRKWDEELLRHGQLSHERWLAAKERGEHKEQPKREQKKKRKREEEKRLHCEVCNIHLQGSHVDEHFDTVEHRRQLVQPGVFERIDEWLGVREDYEGVIKRPSDQKTVWSATEVGVAMNFDPSNWNNEDGRESVEMKREETAMDPMEGPSTAFSSSSSINILPLDPITWNIIHSLRKSCTVEKDKKVKDSPRRKSSSRQSLSVSFSGSQHKSHSQKIVTSKSIKMIRKLRGCILVDRLYEHLEEKELIDFKKEEEKRELRDTVVKEENILNSFRGQDTSLLDRSMDIGTQSSNRLNTSSIDSRGLGQGVMERTQNFHDVIQRLRAKRKTGGFKILDAQSTPVDYQKVSELISTHFRDNGLESASTEEKLQYMIERVVERRGREKCLIDYSSFDGSMEHKSILYKEFSIAMDFVPDSILTTCEPKQTETVLPWSPSVHEKDKILEERRRKRLEIVEDADS